MSFSVIFRCGLVLIGSCLVHWRQSISPRRHSSARRLSGSNSDRQSGSPDVGADGPPPSGKGGPDPSSRTGAGIIRKSCAGTDMRTKTTHVERRYQPFAIGPAEMNRNNVLTRRSRENRTLTMEPWNHGTMEPWNIHSWTVSATKPCRGGPIAPGGRAVARVGFPHRSQLIKTGHHKGVPYIRPNSAQPYIRVVPCTSAACCTSAPPAPGWKLA